MRLMILIIILLLVGCQAEVQINETQPENTTANAQAIPVPDVVPEEPALTDEPVEPALDEPEEPVPEEPVPDEPVPDESALEPTLAQQDLEVFKELVDHYAFVYSSDEYGDVSVFVGENFRKYLFTTYLVEVSVDGDMTSTQLMPTSVTNQEDVERAEARLADYIWRSTNVAQACFLDKENEVEEGTCVESNNISIIYDDVHFVSEPILPPAWLIRYQDIEPVEIREGRNYKDLRQNTQFTVDAVYYDNGDGTETVLYIHNKFKIPVKVEILKDNKPIQTIDYFMLTVNFPYGNAWYPSFMSEDLQ